MLNFKIGDIYKKPTTTQEKFVWIKVVELPKNDKDGTPFMVIDVYDHIDKKWLNVRQPQYLNRPEFTQGWEKVKRALGNA